MGSQPPTPRITAWRPPIAGIREIFHAYFPDHSYPSHTHDAWTLLIIDDGAVRYGLDRLEHAAVPSVVTLLPPYVSHDGRSVNRAGFRKRVIYLEPELIDGALIGAAVDRPSLRDDVLRRHITGLHDALAGPGDELEAESRLAVIRDGLRWHLSRLDPPELTLPGRGVARQLRELLDAHVVDGVRLADAAATLGVSETHLIRTFTREYGLPPHRYLTGRRVDHARRLLLAGTPIAETAARSGFHDQAHLSRHFRRMLHVPPGAFRR
jgi:AraC-like DNA-binding protein